MASEIADKDQFDKQVKKTTEKTIIVGYFTSSEIPELNDIIVSLKNITSFVSTYIK